MRPRLLICLPSWLGDLVAAEPSVRAVLAEYEAEAGLDRVSLAGPAHLLGILDSCFPGARRLPHAASDRQRAASWRGHDLALLLTGSFRSALTAWRAGVPRRVGWARDARGWLLTDSPRPARERGRVALGLGIKGAWPRYLPRPFGTSCEELVGLLGVRVAETRPRLAVRTDTTRRLRTRLEGMGLRPDEPFVLINAGARPASAKGYPAELWGAIAAELSGRDGLAVVMVGGPGEEESVRAALAAAGEARALALLDPVCDLGELAALAAGASVVLTADTGARHVAAAVGAKIVCLVGPTDPRHSAAHLEFTTLLREPVPCGPCHRERCPLAGQEHHACMTSIAVSGVRDAALALLNG